MNFSSVPQGGLRKYCIDSQNWWRAVIIIAPVSLCQAHAHQLQVSGLNVSSCAGRDGQIERTVGRTGGT